MQRLEPAELYGITRDDIQQILQDTLTRFKDAKTRVIMVDASYLYTFDLDDIEFIRPFNILTRYNPFLIRQWHRCLERWCADQTVTDFGKPIKPRKIVRTFDRVPNEGLEMVARCLTGEEMSPVRFHAIGDGAGPGDDALPSDTALVGQVSRIDVEEDPNGGSLTRDGSTIFVVGNHPKTVPDANFTESGIFDHEHSDHDLMVDHSIFPSAVPHVAGADAPGGTTVIYMCSA